jgi:hypothetical protein
MAEPSGRGGHAARRAGQTQAAAIIDLLTTTDPTLLDALRADPGSALRSHSGVRLTSVPESQTDTGCSVAGAYVADTAPPTLAVADSVSPGRRTFTLLHEFGHHLQQSRVELMPALLAAADGGHDLEEAACDAFAADILLPSTTVTSIIGTGGPTADAVAELWTTSRASRAAVCVRAAQTLRSPGHVLLLDDTGTVQFDAAHGQPPVRRGSSQVAVPLIAQALRTGHRATGELALRYRDGITGPTLHAQVADLGGYLGVVAVTDTVPWLRFSLPTADTGPSVDGRICEHCDHEFSTFETSCQKCRSPKCPECGRCACPARLAEQTCMSCFQRLPAHLFDAGTESCRPCRE